MNAMGAFKTTWGIGLDNSTKMYRKFSWGDAIDLFVIDVRPTLPPWPLTLSFPLSNYLFASDPH